MALYESTFICSPELPAEKIDELIEKVKKIIDTAGGKVGVTQQLGRKRLSYPIKKFREGSYVYMELSGSGAMVALIENFYKVNDAVIRYLTVKVEKKKVLKPVAAPVPAPDAASPAPVVPAPAEASPAPATESVQPASQEVKPNESNKPASSGAE